MDCDEHGRGDDQNCPNSNRDAALANLRSRMAQRPGRFPRFLTSPSEQPHKRLRGRSARRSTQSPTPLRRLPCHVWGSGRYGRTLWPQKNRTGVGLAMNTASPRRTSPSQGERRVLEWGPKLNTTSSTCSPCGNSPGGRASSTGCGGGAAAQLSISASTVASLMSTALLAVSRVRFRSLARIRRCASASARSGWVSSSW